MGSAFFSDQYSKAWVRLIPLLPVILYISLLAGNAQNIPLRDDLFAIVAFLPRWQAADGWQEHIEILFAQHHSHRIVATHLVTAALASLNGGAINFIALQAIGWGLWILVWGGLFLSASSRTNLPILGSVLALVLMQPQGSSNLIVGMQTVQNVGIIVIAGVAMLLATRTDRFAWGAAAAALVAPFVSANGILLGPIVVGLALSNRRWLLVFFSSLSTIIGLTVFFWNYHFPLSHFEIKRVLINQMTMVGAPLALFRLSHHAAVLGGLVNLFCIWAVVRTWISGRDKRLVGFLVFLGLSTAMAARGRSGLGPEYMLQDRYHIYGLLMIATLIGLVWPKDSSRRFTPMASWAALGGALIFCVGSYLENWPATKNLWRWNVATAINLQFGQGFPQSDLPDWDRGAQLLRATAQQNSYKAPIILNVAGQRILNQSVEPSTAELIPIKWQENRGLIGLEGLFRDNGFGEPDFAVLRFDEDSFVVLPVLRSRAPLGRFLSTGSLYSTHWSVVLPTPLLRGPSWPTQVELYEVGSDGTPQLMGLDGFSLPRSIADRSRATWSWPDQPRPPGRV